MSDAYTLEQYRLEGVPDVGPRPRPPTRPGWSRRVAADVVSWCETAAIVLGGLLPPAIYAGAGAVTPDWPVAVQSALLAALMYRVCGGPVDVAVVPGRPVDHGLAPSRALGALSLAIATALALGAPAGVGAGDAAVWFVLWLSASYTAAVVVRTVATDVIAARAAEGRFDERIAVYGAGVVARRVHDHLRESHHGLEFVGVYDSRAASDRIAADGLTLAGGLDDLIQVCREGKVDRVVVALPQGADQRVREIARRFADLSVQVQIVTHVASEGGPDWVHRVSHLGPVGLLDVKARRHADWAPIVKRAEDLILGSLALVAVAPMLPVIALAIRLDSPGPILFRQRRRGRNQQLFEVLKFRTMTVMENGADVRQATTGDARVTRVGGFLRAASLDELPQLFNVLRGEMSLVGPRPHALVHDQAWGQLIETYADRHQMKPGITGLAQVRGYRGETTRPEDIEGRVAHDLAYIRSWSLWLDLEILARTVVAVLRGTNAK